MGHYNYISVDLLPEEKLLARIALVEKEIDIIKERIAEFDRQEAERGNHD